MSVPTVLLRLAPALLLLLLALGAAAAEELSARLDRETVFLGESTRLSITLDGEAGDLAPDFSLLLDDFRLTDSTTSSQFQIENGRRSMKTRWSVMLEPRRAGEFTIPPLTVGPSRSQPLKLTVLPPGDRAGGQEIFLEMRAEPRDPYVHAQVLLTLKLHHLQPLTEGRLEEPELDEAVVERLGEDITYSATIDGQRYRVLERRFAVFPERSGSMEIPAARFLGRVASRRSGVSSVFDRGRRVAVASETLELAVRPRPEAFPAPDWIPAQELELTESWPEAAEEFRLGEPLTRRLKLRAKGLLSVQLPELAIPALDGLKIYPDQVQSQSRTDGRWVFGEREQGYALVPTRAGSLQLPEIRIPWWNTAQDRLEEAVLPAREVVVLPGAQPDPPPAPPVVAAQGEARPGAGAGAGWRLAALAGFGLWLLTLLAWWRERGGRGRDAGRAPEPSERPLAGARARRQLEAACGAGDASLAAASLLAWARAEDARAPGNLGALAARTRNPELAAAIRKLDRVLYAQGEASAWRGDELLAALGDGLHLSAGRRPGSSAPAVLPPLYPETES